MKKETWITIGICSVFLLVAGFLYLYTGSGRENAGQEQWIAIDSSDSSKHSLKKSENNHDLEQLTCTVYICGAVKKPGVYSFSEGARVCDAIKAAGGLKKKAVQDAVNQARTLTDGEQITIPTKRSKKKATSSEKSGLVNINTATAEELMTLSGIGESKAQMIIDYREEHGSFQSTEDIMNISGIKEGVFNQIKENITV